MKIKQVLIIPITVVALIVVFYALAYGASRTSTDCKSFVIDSFEVISGIDIPKCDYVNCYYSHESKLRVAIYDLKVPLKLDRFHKADSLEIDSLFTGTHFLQDIEPLPKEVLLAHGKKRGKTWLYALDKNSNRLWVQLHVVNEKKEVD